MNQQSSYQRRFGGIERLYGTPAFHALRQAHVCVVGVGGVGSWTVEALARSGVGRLTLIDLDNVAASNTNRQLHALTSQFGRAKVSVLHERVRDINPECEVVEIEDFVDESNLNGLFGQPFDFVVDAIDQMRVKAAMADHFVRSGQAFVMSGGAGGQCEPALIQRADLSDAVYDPLLAKLRYTLRRRYGFPCGGSKMHVPCVFSTENVRPPQTEAACAVEAAPQGLSCAGYGASMLVTAAFGLHCAQAAVGHIIGKAGAAGRKRKCENDSGCTPYGINFTGDINQNNIIKLDSK